MLKRGEQALPTRRERKELNRNLKAAALRGDHTAALALATIQLTDALTQSNQSIRVIPEVLANADQ